jgi:signal transduction histidine kinase
MTGLDVTGARATGDRVPGARVVRWWRSRLPSLRVRLTLIYGGMFLVAGVVLVSVMYLLVRDRLQPTSSQVIVQSNLAAPSPGAGGAAPDPRALAGQLQQAINTYNNGTLRSLLMYSFLAVGLLLLLAIAIGWLMAGRTLRPLQKITATARRVADRSLHERIALQGPPDELKKLADTFDAMLERLDQAFVGQRRFAANASHELRTPLAINRTLLEVALGDPDASPDLVQLGKTLLATNERSERLIDGLLALAGSETELANRGPVDLADVGGQALDQLAEEASERGVAVHARLAPAVVSGEGVLLERLALNLLQNGIRHNAPGGWVEAVTRQQNGTAELVVANAGPTIPPYEIDGLFEPFRRLHSERTGSDRGVGLGLSIVRSVVRAHGGRVTAVPRDGGGLVVRVTLPLLATSGPGPARVADARDPAILGG